MSIDYEAENWFGNPTPEEMYKHHAKLVDAENELLRLEVDRYRKNQAKLIDMLAEIRASRDKLGKDLNEANRAISDIRAESYERSREVGSLKRILSQREAVMRQHNIPEVYFGSPRTEQ